MATLLDPGAGSGSGFGGWNRGLMILSATCELDGIVVAPGRAGGLRGPTSQSFPGGGVSVCILGGRSCVKLDSTQILKHVYVPGGQQPSAAASH